MGRIFFGSKWLSGVVVSVSRTCLAGWFGSLKPIL